jgi:Lipocalin-like domain
MTARVRNILAGSVLLLLAVASLTAALAQAPAKSLKDQLVGHWQLLSISINNVTPYGLNPQGSMILDADGHYSVIVISDGGARSISYYGTYTVNDADGSMTMHIDGSTRAKTDGHDEKRVVTLSGDALTVANPPSGHGSILLNWKRSS